MRHQPLSPLTLALLLALAALPLGGCNNASPPKDSASESNARAEDGGKAEDQTTADSSMATQIELSPENTVIQFVGTHVGDKPDPRTGRFADFAGTLTVRDGKLNAIQVEIDTTSLSTEIDKLTEHLKSGDFFAVMAHPTARIQSTKIEQTSDDQYLITADLTMLGKTAPVTFPATVSTDGKVTLESQFTLDRTQWGMDYAVDKVEKEVAMSVTVNR